MTTAILLGIKSIMQLPIRPHLDMKPPLWQFKRKIKVKTTLTKKEKLSHEKMQKVAENPNIYEFCQGSWSKYAPV